jgi:outer membrane protein assembly factor BamB
MLSRKAVVNGLLVGIFVFSTGLCNNAVQAVDWRQWRGPHRDGKSTERHLLKSWPTGGPKLLWSVQGLGKGYASLAISKGTVYTTGMIDGQGFIFAYDLNGRLKWRKTYGPEWSGSRPGSHCTPTVDGDRVYVISALGSVVCFSGDDGERKWSLDMVREFGARNLKWGIAEAPLIVDDKIICTPGGPDIAIAALDKMTGKVIWTVTGLNQKSAYCSPILINRGQRRLIVTILQKSIVAIDPETAELVWRIPHQAQYDISAVSPLYGNGRLYVTNGYGKGGIMYEISPDGTEYERKWVDKVLDCHHGGVVLVNGHIYGMSNNGSLVCQELASGKITCQDKTIGKGSIIYADGLLYCYEETQGTISLVKPGTNAVSVVSSFNAPEGSGEHWAHPAISDGRLYIRHGEALMVYDIRGTWAG